MPNDFTQAIQEVAMETEDNLIVFVRTAQSFEEFYKKLVSSFLNKLQEELMKKFPEENGWRFFAIDLIAEKYKSWGYLLYVHSESWSSPILRVGIWADTRFNNVEYGIGWDKEKDSTHHRQLHDHIFTKMSQRFQGGTRNKWQPFFIRNHFKFSDWSKEDAIISMRQVIKGEPPAGILDFFCNELVAIVEALDNCLKGWSQCNPNP